MVVGVGVPAGAAGGDAHSLANPGQVAVRHMALDLAVDFEARELIGTATLTVERLAGAGAETPLVLDTRGLRLEGVTDADGGGGLAFTLGPADPLLGSALGVTLPAGVKRVAIAYRTDPGATALQWVAPGGTAGGKPFLYSQSQSIHARSWFPCQDSPGARLTYEAVVATPPGFTAVMSAEGPEALDPDPARPGWQRSGFRMAQAIPPYLVALAVGDLRRAELGARTAVWAEASVVDRAAFEFADAERMLDVAERLFGPYRWGRYDILVLPPSFPFGGMENARLTFATPTVIAGDRSLVALIAHELGHSWAGNLATCATWEHLWINEGLTTYIERRIVEAVYGKAQADMERVLGLAGLREEMERLDDASEVLAPRLDGQDPDTALTGVPYEKGALFLERLEQAFGRDRFDAFLKAYFAEYAFRSLDTRAFEAYLKEHLFAANPPAAAAIDLDRWLRQPGLPADAPVPASALLDEVDALAAQFNAGTLAAGGLPWAKWSTLERVRFLQKLPPRLDPARLASLDAAFLITERANPEVAVPWLERCIRSGYAAADGRLDAFLGSIGRMRYLEPLYRALVESPAGRDRAKAAFEMARAGYHPLAAQAVQSILEAP